MTTAVLAGSTGLVGSHILTHLLTSPNTSSVHAYTRRSLPTADPKAHALQSTDTSTWSSLFPQSAQLFLSALGTTKASAGSVEKQRAIDLDLNYSLAQAAKSAGVDTYVLISSQGANSASSFAYPKMKGELEDKVKALGFKHCVILRPGLIVGDRQESRPAEAVARFLAGALRKVSPGMVEGFAQDADVIAKAAVRAGELCLQGKRDEGVWMLGQAEIVKLAKEDN
ncbi:NAD dependent epimerase/dehydratase family protein-like protein [Sporormia fimetaria CBS 119925]|uniref:NAD dependent epimerase/dehydratase family protein-like protein n=1 Tax=Sporormia fimetaria CBS 119925 TaxID=1340428 RepID=A0A6A6UZC6_9PLEO|nr:NAD dependent epimerase/dehydratase family protein-like protein [Sporormia fimetaria CBS 119925]